MGLEAAGHKKADKLAPLSPSWLSAMLLVAPLSIFGEILLLKTHHRPLGAATFATVATLMWAASEIVSRRVLSPDASPRRAAARKWAWWISLSASCLVLLRSLF